MCGITSEDGLSGTPGYPWLFVPRIGSRSPRSRALSQFDPLIDVGLQALRGLVTRPGGHF
jgi:hypothetical protein